MHTQTLLIQHTLLIRNVVTTMALVTIVSSIAVYLMYPMQRSVPGVVTSDGEPLISFATSTTIISGTVQSILSESFTLTLPGLPAEVTTIEGDRSVTISSTTEFVYRQYLTETEFTAVQDEYAQQRKRLLNNFIKEQVGFDRESAIAALATNRATSSTGVAKTFATTTQTQSPIPLYGTTSLPGVVFTADGVNFDQGLTQKLETFLATLPAPLPYRETPVLRDRLYEGATVIVFASETVFMRQQFMANRVVLVSSPPN